MFKVGDKVRWSSQSAGSYKTKEGVVIEVIPERKYVESRHYAGHQFDSGSRQEESYIVKVGSKRYWPRVSMLQKVDPTEH